MILRRAVASLLLPLLFALPALGDGIELRDGRRLEGNLLGAGPNRVVFDGPQGVEFFPRAQVVRVTDAQGRIDSLIRSAEQRDPIGVANKVEGSVRVLRRDEELNVSIHGALSVLREGDELRTGPYGRAGLLLPCGGYAFAQRDAIVRFEDGVPSLLEGKLNLTRDGEVVQAFLPEGRVAVMEGELSLEHVRGRSQLLCLEGRAVFRSSAGYRIDLPRSHIMTIQAEGEQELGSIQASTTNAWPLRLEFGARRISIQPGERIVLLGAPVEQAPRPRAPQPLPEPDIDVVARVLRATGSFGLQRAGLSPRMVDQAEARGFAIQAGDQLVTAAGELFLQAGLGRAHALPDTTFSLGEDASFELESGELSLETSGQLSVALADGSLGLMNGEVSLARQDELLRIGIKRGTAQVGFGEEVRAELLAPTELEVQQAPGGRRLAVPATAEQVPLVLARVDMTLKPGRQASFRRVGERRVIELWNGAVLEMMQPHRARVIAGPEETELLEFSEDGAQVVLRPGVYRFGIEDGRIAASSLPEGVRLVRPGEAPEAPGALAARGPAPQPEQESAQTLANGAVVEVTPGCPFEVRRREQGFVVVAIPGGEVWLSAGARAKFSQRGGYSRFALADGRFIEHEEGAGPYEARVEADGRLLVRVFQGAARQRQLEVERHTRFDLSIRRDEYVLAYVYGQAVYVEPGQRMAVTQRSGLRTYMAAER